MEHWRLVLQMLSAIYLGEYIKLLLACGGLVVIAMHMPVFNTAIQMLSLSDCGHLMMAMSLITAVTLCSSIRILIVYTVQSC